MLSGIELRAVNDVTSAHVAKFFHDVWHETQAQLQHPAKAQYRDEAFFYDRMQGRANTVAAYSANQLAGFVSWTDSKLNSLFVHKDFRNQSVGLQLLQLAEKDMLTHGHQKFELNCVCGNDGAKRFYERHGWRLSHIEMHEREKPEGLIVQKVWLMVKP
jgi:GNAT superfamily N-acetyltransferase